MEHANADNGMTDINNCPNHHRQQNMHLKSCLCEFECELVINYTMKEHINTLTEENKGISKIPQVSYALEPKKNFINIFS